MNEAENEEDVVNEDVEEGERHNVHHRTGPGCLTSMAIHTSVSLEPKKLWVKLTFWMKVVDEGAVGDLNVKVEDVQDSVDVGLRWVEDGGVAG